MSQVRNSLACALVATLTASVASIASADEPPPDAVPEDVVHVRAQGRGVGQQQERSGQAVTVIDLERQRGEAADLGEVLARTEGVSVRRSGGLGSAAQLNLRGLGGDRVRVFVDGLPIAWTGHSMGIANVPLHGLERVEVHHGVVPVRFGADALGGAINLVTDRRTRGTRSSASAHAASFGQYRAAASLRSLTPDGHYFGKLSGFADSADNDYPVAVDGLNPDGSTYPTVRRRFHDGYQALGVHGEIAALQLAWASRLSLAGFYVRQDRDLQHNLLMTVPYGEATYGKRTAGARIEYENRLFELGQASLLVGYSRIQTGFVDLSRCRYDWDGACLAMLPVAGEVEPTPHDQLVGDHVWFGKLGAELPLGLDHELSVSFVPRWVQRRGTDRAIPEGSYDRWRAHRTSITAVGGAELTSRLLDERLRNLGFVKLYAGRASTLESLPNGELRDWERNTLHWGVGDGLSLDLSSRMHARASYEWATRLPEPDELFGNGGLTIENLELLPERSHNLNLGLELAPPTHDDAGLEAAVTGFSRFADSLILLVGDIGYQRFDNIGQVRVLGVEGSARVHGRGDVWSLGVGATLQDARNTADTGPSARYRGQAVPNQPNRFAHADLRVSFRDLLLSASRLSLSYDTRFVGSFFRGWEGDGAANTKLSVPTQVLQSAGLNYSAGIGGNHGTASFEVQNLGDARAYDYFGAQRPGRSFHFKLTLETGHREPST